MGRESRIEVAGWYHVTTRTVDGLDAFAAPDEALLLERLVARATRQFTWTCVAYCIMSNHYHFVAAVPEATLAAGNHVINSVFAREFNASRGRTGHVFEARYHSEPIVQDTHLMAACRYDDLNPVRAGICVDPAQWRWSSFGAIAGLRPAPDFLDVDATLALFGRTPEEARAEYVRFVYQGISAA